MTENTIGQFHGKVQEPFEFKWWMLAIALVITYHVLNYVVRKYIRGRNAKFISPLELARKFKDDEDFILIDVSVKNAIYETIGYIDGSIFIPATEFEAKIDSNFAELLEHRDTNIVLTDMKEEKSYKFAIMLKKYGFTNVEVLSGGIVGWIRCGLDVKRNKQEAE